MNRTDQKTIIKEILTLIEDVKYNLKSKESEIEKALQLAEQLNNSLQNLEIESAFDLEDFTDNVFKEAVGSELESVYDEIYNFKADIEDYISELSENKAEVLEKRYEFLEDALEKFDQSYQEYSSIEEAYEHIDEAVDMLKGMLK